MQLCPEGMERMQIQFSTTLGPYFAELVCRACGTVCLRRPRFGPMLGASGTHCRMYGSTLGCVGPIFAHVGPMLVMLGNVGPALGPHCAYLELFWAALEQRHRDLGVAQDCLGNFIYFLLDRFPGASKDKRLSSVFRSMQSFYRRSSVDNRLDTLTIWECPGGPTKKQTKSQLPSLEHLLEKPGLSYHGAWKLQRHCWTSPTHLKTPFSMIECSLLSRDLWNPQELATAGQRFLLLYVSLSDSDPEGMFWRFKPKHHLFQELCEFDECCPSQNWTYRDEDMGGTVAAISRRRGGEPCLPFGVCLCFFPLASFYLV